jgi:hypothetical protein
VTDSRVQIRNSEYSNTLFELAYHHHRVDVPVLRGKRIGTTACSTVSVVAVTEYGNAVTISDIDCSDYRASGDYAFRTSVNVATPLTEIKSAIIRGAQLCGLVIGSNGQRGNLTRIGRVVVLGCSGTTAFGGAFGRAVQVDADQVDIGTIEVENLESAGAAVNLLSTAGDAVRIAYSRFSTGPAAGVQYRILDQRAVSRRKYINPIRGQYAQQRALILNAGSVSSASSGVDFVAQTYTVTAGTSGARTGWRVRAGGNIPATVAAAARTVKVNTTINGAVATLGTVTMTSAQSGQFLIEGTIQKLAGQTATMVRGLGSNLGTSTVTPSGGLQINSMATFDMTVTLVVNTNTADSIVQYEFSVEPYNDETETT